MLAVFRHDLLKQAAYTYEGMMWSSDAGRTRAGGLRHSALVEMTSSV
jgi:hypothetical protein